MTMHEGAEAESPDAGDGWIPAHMTRDGVEVMYLDHVRYERDPLSAAFPDLTDEEIEMLALSIDSTGQRLPISINAETDTVIDGWQRLRACFVINRTPEVERVTVKSPAALVMALNEHRRGVKSKTAVQRAFVAIDLFAAEQKQTGAKKQATAAQVAKAAGCGTRTIDQIRQAIKYDAKHKTSFETALRRGRMSGSEAYEAIHRLEDGSDGDADAGSDASAAKAESREADLSFLDAAEEILRDSESREPLHYQVITKRALERGLIQTEDQNPATAVLDVIYADIRRRDRRGEGPRFLPHGHGRIGIAAWAPGGLASLIEEQNAEVRQALLDRARDSSSTEFEELVAALLSKMGFKDTEVTPLGGDGGIDVRGTRVEGAVHTRVAVQVKRWQANVHRPIVQQVRGSLGAHEQGWIITTSDFSSGAKEEATRADATPVALISGQQFAALLMEHEIGVRRATHDLFTLEEGESEV